MTSDPHPRPLDRLMIRAAAWVRRKLAEARARKRARAASR